MSSRLVLDAAAFDVVDTGMGQVRSLPRQANNRGESIYCAAVTLAEVCRGPARTRRAENVLARVRGGRRVVVVPTDERLAKLVGAILHDTDSGSERLAARTSSRSARAPSPPSCSPATRTTSPN